MVSLYHQSCLSTLYMFLLHVWDTLYAPCSPVSGWVVREDEDTSRAVLGDYNCTMVCLAGLEVAEEGVLVCRDYNGRPSGEAFVELTCEEDIEKAVEKHNESMGHRWGHSLGRGCVVFLVQTRVLLETSVFIDLINIQRGRLLALGELSTRQ